MKSLDTKVIGHLNTVLKNELTAINQYFLHAKMLDDWGLKKMGKMEMEESVDEMKHADSIIERILFLEGLPNLQDLGKLMIGQNVKEMLECDLALEMIAIPDLRAAIVDCEACGDFGSRDLFNNILMSEEEHVDWLETQLGLIEKRASKITFRRKWASSLKGVKVCLGVDVNEGALIFVDINGGGIMRCVPLLNASTACANVVSQRPA